MVEAAVATPAAPTAPSPVLSREERWQAPTVDPNMVQKTLQRLWLEIADEKRKALGRPRPSIDGGVMRTRTINLIVVADTPADVERINGTVTALTEFFPSRTLILVREASRHTAAGLDVTVAVEERPSERFKTPIRFETVTVSTGDGREELLPSVASPILVPELPDFVWYPSGSFPESGLLDELLNTSDRLIVDTSLTSDPSVALRFLRDLHGRSSETLHMSDVAWTRLMPWRQMIAQFFDQAIYQPYLQAIEEVVIDYAETDASGRSGLTGGLLAAAWLCTRLGWRAPGEELVRSKDGWKLTLRAGERGRSREVILMLRPTKQPAARRCLDSVRLVAGGDRPATFEVRRINQESIETTSEAPVKVSRIVFVRVPDDELLLSLELRVFGEDAVYAEALRFAANLWPEGVPS